MEHAHRQEDESRPGSVEPEDTPSNQQGTEHNHEHMVADYRRRFWISLALTPPILILSPAIQEFLGLRQALQFNGDIFVLFVLSTILFFYGGAPFLRGSARDMRHGTPGMMTLVALAITTAYAYSTAVVFGLSGPIFYWELATLIDIMLLGHWMEMKSVMGASRALEELAKLMPSEAHLVLPDGSVQDVALSELKRGDRVLVKPGEKIPADGRVVDGETSVNEAMLTGESLPVTKGPGETAIGGSINGEGSITIEIEKTGRDSYLEQVIELVKTAQESKSKTQDLANRAAMYLTIVGISAGILTFFAWTAIANRDIAFALERTVTVLVITCPHALGLAIPLVVAVSTALSAQNGLLIRDRTAFESARNIDAIVFDKTGTLTKGEFGITDVMLFETGVDEEELLELAAAVESRSEHPIAKGIAKGSGALRPVEDFRAIPGKGAEGRVDGRKVAVVSPGYLRERDLSVSDDRIDKVSRQGKTVVFVLVDDIAVGALALADIIRPESKEAVRKLKEMGIRAMMLTGDNPQTAQWVAEAIGLDEYFAEVLPDEKAAKIKEVQSRGLTVAMTGDGVNDAPALAQADVGIAIGAGTDVAVETADIVLVKNSPLDAVAIIGLSKATYRKMVQNLAWATGYNVFAIPVAAGVLVGFGILLTPAIGAALMSLSTIIVAVNAKFLRMPSA